MTPDEYEPQVAIAADVHQVAADVRAQTRALELIALALSTVVTTQVPELVAAIATRRAAIIAGDPK